MKNNSFVCDTNVLISAALFRSSIPRQVFNHAFMHRVMLFSDASFDELQKVLRRPRFDKYLTHEERQDFVDYIVQSSQRVSVVEMVNVCRDPKDNMFLDVAINGSAQLLITGDNDLLVLSPFRSVQIMTPAQYLNAFVQPEL